MGCVGGNEANDCTTCRSETDHRTLSEGSCLCNNRYYDNDVEVCARKLLWRDLNIYLLACHYSCLTCDGSEATNCLSCESSDFRNPVSESNTCTC